MKFYEQISGYQFTKTFAKNFKQESELNFHAQYQFRSMAEGNTGNDEECIKMKKLNELKKELIEMLS